jgi:hypothetical protein
MLTRITPTPPDNFDAVTTWSGTTIGRCFSFEPGITSVGRAVDPSAFRTVNV